MSGRPYESCGRQVTVTGWVCDKCRRFYGSGEDAEHLARWCCCSDRPCHTPGCGGRADKSWIACPSCLSKKDLDRFMAKPRVEWDGITPLVTDDDRFFFDADSLGDYLADLPAEDREIVRLEVCRPTNTSEFYMSEFLQDSLPEDFDLDEDEINATVNRWIKDNGPFAWEGSGKVPTWESVERVLGKLSEIGQ